MEQDFGYSKIGRLCGSTGPKLARDKTVGEMKEMMSTILGKCEKIKDCISQPHPQNPKTPHFENMDALSFSVAD